MNVPAHGSSRAMGVWAAVVTVVIWSMFIVIARAAAQHRLAPLDIVFARLLGSGAILLPLGWWLCRSQVRRGGMRGWLGLSPLAAEPTALLGLTGGLGYVLLVYTGFFFAPASHASVLMPGSMPLWTALLAMLLLGERLTSWRLACLGLILLGGVIVAGASIWTGLGWGAGTATGGGEAGEHWKGDLFFICGAVLWSLYGVLVRRLKADPVAATTATTVFAFLLFVPPYALAWMGGWAGSGLDRNSLGEFAWQALFQGVVSVVIAGITFTAMVRSFGPVRSSMITALVPGLSALGAVVFLGEPMHAALLVGLLLVTSGILLSVRGGLAGSSNDGGVVR